MFFLFGPIIAGCGSVVVDLFIVAHNVCVCVCGGVGGGVCLVFVLL